ncbi:neurofascin-like [Tubulanus polymorphus]|uniref:neurofascin-like n=1 Tax=Tubulanus polymorphus TaxID=672921 RepID=UPI003DA32735
MKHALQMGCIRIIICVALVVAAATANKREPEPPVITEGPSDVINSVNLFLQCQASGYPKPNITWYKDGESLKKVAAEDEAGDITVRPSQREFGADGKFNVKTGSLRIRMGDTWNGNFYCVAENQYGNVTSKTVNFEKPVLEERRSYKTYSEQVNQYTKLELDCDPDKIISIVPERYAKRSWVLYSGPDSDNGGLHAHPIADDYRRFVTDDGKLIIANVDKQDEALNQRYYVCEVTNRLLATRKYASKWHVSVKSSGNNQAQGWKLFYPPNYVTPIEIQALEGEDIQFRCAFSGLPIPRVFWYKDNGYEPLAKNQLAFAIKNVRVEDEGSYHCKLDPRHGYTGTQPTFKLQVDSKPRWIEKPGRVSVYSGDRENVTLRCAASGQPEPSIQWIVDDQVIPIGANTKYVNKNDNKLILLNPRPTDPKRKFISVTCQIKNRYATERSYGFVFVSPFPITTPPPATVKTTPKQRAKEDIPKLGVVGAYSTASGLQSTVGLLLISTAMLTLVNLF